MQLDAGRGVTIGGVRQLGFAVLLLAGQSCPGSVGMRPGHNTWTVGIASAVSDERQATPTNNPLTGAIDSLRISSVRRAFGASDE